MAFKRNVGTAYMPVLPDMSNFQRELRAGLSRITNDAQSLMGDAFRNGIRDGLRASQPAVDALGQAVQTTTQDATQQGVAGGLQAGAQAGAQAATANVSVTVQNATQQGAQQGSQQGTQRGVTRGARRGAAAGGRSIRSEAGEAARKGVSSGLKLGFGALAGIAAAAVAAAGIAALFASAVSEGLASGFETSKVSSRLNLNTEENKSLDSAVKTLSKKSIYEAESIRAAAESVARADRGLLKDQKAFEKAVTSISLLVDMYDMDPNLLAQPLANFTKDGGTIDQFADMIVGAIGSSSGNMEDILDSLAEYGSEFAGAQQHFVSLSAFLTSRGLRNTDVLADAVREMRLRASEGGEEWVAAVKALGLEPREFRAAAAKGGAEWMDAFTDALSGAGKVGDKGFSTILETLGGGPLGDYARVFADLKEADWKQFNKGAAEGAATVASIEEKLSNNPITQWHQTIAELKSMMVEIAQPVTDFLLPILSKVNDWLQSNRDGIVAAGQELAQRLIPVFEWLVAKMGELFTWIGNNSGGFVAFAESIMGMVLPVIGWLAEKVSELFGWVRENKNMFGLLAEVFFIIANVVWTTLGPPLGFLLGIIKNIAEWMIEHEGVTKQLATALGFTLVGAIIMATVHMTALALSTLAATWPFLAIAALIGLIVFALYDLNNSVIEVYGSWGNLGNNIAEFFGGLYDSVAGFISGILDWIDELISAIMGVEVPFTDMMGAAWGHRPGTMSVSGGVPALATGGTVLPQSGGTIVRLAEAGRAETVVDTGLMNRHLSTSLSLFERTVVDRDGSTGGDHGIYVSGDLVLQASSADDARSLHKKITEQKTFDGRRKR